MVKKVLVDIAKTKKIANSDAEKLREKGWKIKIEDAPRHWRNAGKFSGRYALYYTGKARGKK